MGTISTAAAMAKTSCILSLQQKASLTEGDDTHAVKAWLVQRVRQSGGRGAFCSSESRLCCALGERRRWGPRDVYSGPCIILHKRLCAAFGEGARLVDGDARGALLRGLWAAPTKREGIHLPLPRGEAEAATVNVRTQEAIEAASFFLPLPRGEAEAARLERGVNLRLVVG